MSTISIIAEQDDAVATRFSAISATRKATGRTVGEALDALTAQPSEETATMAVVQLFSPDQFFSAAQRERLSALMSRWRTARETSEVSPSSDQEELERLVDEEVQGAGKRAEHVSHSLERENFVLQYQKFQQVSRIAFAIGILEVLTVIAAAVLISEGAFTFGVIAMIVCAFASVTTLILTRWPESTLQRTAFLQESKFWELLSTLESLEPERTPNQHDKTRSK